jgi:hypothetical protein
MNKLRNNSESKVRTYILTSKLKFLIDFNYFEFKKAAACEKSSVL